MMWTELGIAVRPGAPAVQRRAPLRLDAVCCRDPGAEVLPPIKGGLYCGIYLREKKVFEPTGAPAVRRAPLRLRSRRHEGPGLALVVPPFDGGLHCGTLVAQYW